MHVLLWRAAASFWLRLLAFVRARGRADVAGRGPGTVECWGMWTALALAPQFARSSAQDGTPPSNQPLRCMRISRPLPQR